MKDTNKQKQFKNKYWLYGGLGTGLLGFGLSALVESGFLKYNNAPIWQWVLAGTFSLILIMAGVNLLFASFEHKLKLNNKQ